MCRNELKSLCNLVSFFLCLSFSRCVPQRPLSSWWGTPRITPTPSFRGYTAAWPIRPRARCENSSPTSVCSCWGLSSAWMSWCRGSSTLSSRSSTITSSTQVLVKCHQATPSAWGHRDATWGRSVWRPASWRIRSLAPGSPGSSSFRRCTSASRSSTPQTTCSWAASADGPCWRCTTVLTARYGCSSLGWVYLKVFPRITDPNVIMFHRAWPSRSPAWVTASTWCGAVWRAWPRSTPTGGSSSARWRACRRGCKDLRT